MVTPRVGNEIQSLVRSYLVNGSEHLSLSEMLAQVKQNHPDDYKALAHQVIGRLNNPRRSHEQAEQEAVRQQSINQAAEKFDFGDEELTHGIPSGDTFGGFEDVEGSPDVLSARIAAEGWVSGVSAPIMTFAGLPGVGKTRLLTAAANQLLDAGEQVVFRTEAEIIEEAWKSVRENRLEQYIVSISRIRWLVVDEFARTMARGTVLEAMDDFWDSRWRNAGYLRTLVATNIPASSMPSQLARVMSRLGDKLLASHMNIDAPDWRRTHGST
jgi:chromosomal replication initiation ATPase DnaA